MFKAYTRKWIVCKPFGRGNCHYIALWICDENEEPKYVFKKNYEFAKNRYALNKYTDQYPWYYNKKVLYPPKPEWKLPSYFEEEFDAKYKDKTIDLEYGYPREFL